MNKYDIENIKKIIKSRNPIKYSDKGEESLEKFQSMSTEELTKIVKDFENNTFKEASKKFKEIVKYLFDTYANEEDNIILLSECYGDYDGGRELHAIDIADIFFHYTDFSVIDFSRYNKWAKTLNFVEEDEDYDPECRKPISDVEEKYKVLGNLMRELNIPSAAKIYNDDDGVNCYWHGYVAVTKDYKIGNFICSDNDLMLNEEKMGPKIIMEL